MKQFESLEYYLSMMGGCYIWAVGAFFSTKEMEQIRYCTEFSYETVRGSFRGAI